jgi:putative transposase
VGGAGLGIEESCAERNASEAVEYEGKLARGRPQEAQRLKQLEDENRRLKHMVADQALDIQALRAVLEKTCDDRRQAQRGEPRRGRVEDEPAPGRSVGAGHAFLRIAIFAGHAETLVG